MFQEGQQIGPYTLIHKLGQGGFGEVWLAENRTKFATTQVAVKLPLDKQIDHSLIEQEAQLWAMASGHPNILPIIEANEYNGQIVIVSEYSPDGSLKHLLDENGGKLPIEKAIEITIGILKGLEFLHSRKIIHRDLTPDNILLQGDVPRLTDFGISRVIKTTVHTTNVAGKPHYLSPEAFRGRRNVQTDVWSVGVMLYQMLKGSLPFKGNNIAEIYASLMEKEAESLPNDIPTDLQNIVMKSLAKNPTENYQSTMEMSKDLDNFWFSGSHKISLLPTENSVSKESEKKESIVISENNEETEPLINLFHSQEPEKTSHFSVSEDNEVTENIIKFFESKEIAETPPITKNEDYSQQENNENLKNSTPSPALSNRKNIWRNVVISVLIFSFLGLIGGGIWLNREIKTPVVADTSTDNTPTPNPEVTPSPNKVEEATLIPFRKGNKWGFSDKNKNIIVEPKYDEVAMFSEGLASVRIKKKVGFIDEAGKEIIPLKYEYDYDYGGDYLHSFSENLLIVKANGKYGFIDKNDNVVIPFKYDGAWSFSGGLAKVDIKDKSGLIDKTGNIVVPIEYDYISDFSEGLAKVLLNGKYGFIDKAGNVVIPIKYDSASNFSEGVVIVRLDGKIGYVDKTGKELFFLPEDEQIRSLHELKFAEGVVIISLGNTLVFIDKTGKQILSKKYEEYVSANPFSEGLALVNKGGSMMGGKYGFIDTTGNFIIPPMYDYASKFSEELAYVRNETGKYGFIDKMGNTVVSFKYNGANNFSNGLALVTLDEKDFYIDKNGTEYYEPASKVNSQSSNKQTNVIYPANKAFDNK